MRPKGETTAEYISAHAPAAIALGALITVKLAILAAIALVVAAII